MASSAMATTKVVNLGKAIDLRTLEKHDIKIKGLALTASSVASDSNPKVFNTWKNCFTRHENNPPMPWERYIYRGLRVTESVKNAIILGINHRTLIVDETLILEKMDEVTNALKDKTEGKCELTTSTQVEVDYSIKVNGQEIALTNRFFLTSQNGKLGVLFSKWSDDFRTNSALEQTLPNKTPIDFVIP